MSDANPPDNPAPDETSQPAATRPAEATGAAAPVGGDPVPDAAPASGPTDATSGGSSEAGASSPAQADPADEPAPSEPDPVRDAILERIQGAIGDGVVGSMVAKGDLWVRVDRSAWRATLQHLKDHGFTYFCFLSGIDWMVSSDLSNRYEQTFTGDEAATDEVEPPPMTAGVAGGDTRFQVFARVYDTDNHVGVTVKADLDDAEPSVDSIVTVFRGADWHEREAWEMYGFDFVGHPGLRHLYLPTGFEGFPLRKDFPLLARAVKPWPGLVDKEPVPGEDEEEEAAAAT